MRNTYRYGDSNFFGKRARARRTARRERRNERKDLRMERKRARTENAKNGNTFFNKIGNAAGGLIQNITGGAEPVQAPENFRASAPVENFGAPAQAVQPEKDNTQMYIIVAVVIAVLFFSFKDKILG